MLDKGFYEDDDLVFIEEGWEEAEEGEGGKDGHGVGGEGVCPRQCCVHFQTTIFQVGVEYSKLNAQLGFLLDEVYTMQRSERFATFQTWSLKIFGAKWGQALARLFRVINIYLSSGLLKT